MTASEANVVPFPRKYDDTDVKAENLQRDATEESFKDSNGFIPVVVVVSVVVVVLIIVLSCCCYRRRKANKKNAIEKDIQDAISIESEEVPIPAPMPKDNTKPLKIVLMNKPDQKKLEQKPSQPLKDAKVDEVVIPVPSHGNENTIEHPKLEIANEILDTKSDKVHVENEVLDEKSEILDAGPAILQQDNESLRSNSVASTESGGIQITVNHEDHVPEDKDSLHDENKDLDEKVNEVLSDIDEILSVQEVLEEKLDAESHDGSRAESLQDVGSTHNEVENDDVSGHLDQISTREPSLQEQEHEKSDSDNDEPSVKEAIAESSEVAAFIEEHQEEKPHLDKEEKDDKEDREDRQSISSDKKDTENDNLLNMMDSVANESDRDNENPNVSRDSNEKDPEEASISH